MEQPTRKFELIKECPSRYKIKTPQGWKGIKNVMKTVPYTVWYIELDNGDSLKCADTHIVYTDLHTSIYVCDVKVGQLIETDTGYHKCVKVEDLGYEENMYDVEVDSDEHEYYSNNFISHNTTCSAIYILWYSIFNKEKKIAILANKAAVAKKILEEIKYAYENLPEYIKPGAVEYNAYNIKFDTDTEIMCSATTPSALRGYSISLLFMDELAFVNPPSLAEEFWTSNWPILSTGGSSIIVSTPKGTANLFYKLWKDAVDGKNTLKPLMVKWNAHPDRDQKWYEETIRNMGKVSFHQEHDCSFFGSSSTLIDGQFILNGLKQIDPIDQPDQWTKYWDKPKHNRKYAISIDVSQGVGSDYSVANVFDITDYPEGAVKQVFCYRRNDINVPIFTSIVHEIAKEWNNAYLIIETNANLGEELQRIMMESNEYENIFYDYEKNSYGVFANRGNKPAACSWLKELIENNKIQVYDGQLIEEFGYFEELKEGVFKAKNNKGCHDDLVATCLWLSYFLKSKYFADIKDSWVFDESPSEEVKDKEAYEVWNNFLTKDYEEVENNWLDKDINGKNNRNSNSVWW